MENNVALLKKSKKELMIQMLKNKILVFNKVINLHKLNN